MPEQLQSLYCPTNTFTLRPEERPQARLFLQLPERLFAEEEEILNGQRRLCGAGVQALPKLALSYVIS